MQTLLRLMFGRIGRAAGVGLILAAVWFYWWMWPESPLRTIRLDSQGHGIPDCGCLSTDGSTLLITDWLNTNLLKKLEQHLIDLRTGTELIDAKALADGPANLYPDKPWLWLGSWVKDSPEARVYDYRERRWIKPSDFEAGRSGLIFSEEEIDLPLHPRSVLSRDKRWRMGQFSSRDHTFVHRWMSDFFGLKFGYGSRYVIWDAATGISSRSLIGEGLRWVSFALNDRAWTTRAASAHDDIFVEEWDISHRRLGPPWWLYALTAAGVLVIFFDFRRGRADASAKRR